MIKVEIVEKSKITHELRVEKEGRVFRLFLCGYSKFRLLDDEQNNWDSAEIDFKDKLRFSVNIFDRLISCFSFDLTILKYLVEEKAEVLEGYINTALTDIDMAENIFQVREVPISKGSQKLRAYLDFDKLNVTACIILCSPDYRNIMLRHNGNEKMRYVKMIANKNKVLPIVERSLRSIEKEFEYKVIPMTPVTVEEFLVNYLKKV